MDTSISGRISVRPVRVGLAIGTGELDSTLETCIELATSSWGGQLYPIIPMADLAEGIAIAEFFDVDVIHSVDGEDIATQASKTIGYQWRWTSSSPFDRSDELGRDHVLGMEEVLEAHDRQNSALRPVLVTWDDEHPLRLLNGVLFGKFADDEIGGQLASRFGSTAASTYLDKDADLPVLATRNPLTATTYELHRVDRLRSGIAVIDASNPSDVIAFWNHRALGHDVVPWPLGHESLVEGLVALWLAEQADHWPLVWGDRPGLNVWTRGGTVPDSLSEFLTRNLDDDVTQFVSDLSAYSAPVNPYERSTTSTHASRSFDATIDRKAWQFEIPLPEIDFLPRRFWSDQCGVVAVEIEATSEYDLRPGRKATELLPKALG